MQRLLISAAPEVQLPTLTYQKCTSDESAIKPGGAHPAQIRMQHPSSSGQAAPFHVIQNPRLFPFCKLYFPAQDAIQSMALNPFKMYFLSKAAAALYLMQSQLQVITCTGKQCLHLSNWSYIQLHANVAFVSVLEMKHLHKNTTLKCELVQLSQATVQQPSMNNHENVSLYDVKNIGNFYSTLHFTHLPNCIKQ